MYLCVKRASHWRTGDGRDIMPAGSNADDLDAEEFTPITDIIVITSIIEPVPEGYETVNMLRVDV